MKKILNMILTIIMVIALCVTLTACATVNSDGSPTVAGVAIEQGITVVARALEALLAVAGTWLIGKLGKRKELQNTSAAMGILFDVVRQTVGELQQTVVDNLKALAENGKLSDTQVYELQCRLQELVRMKLDMATQDVLIGAGCDLTALISGAAEDWINTLHNNIAYVQELPTYTIGPEIKDTSEADKETE